MSVIVCLWLTEPTVTTTWLLLSDFFFETFNKNLIFDLQWNHLQHLSVILSYNLLIEFELCYVTMNWKDFA